MNFVSAQLEGDRIRLPFGDVPLPDRLRGRLKGGGGARDVIAGIRPEHFEDARIAGEGLAGPTFRAKVAVMESMGSELYLYFDVESQADATDLQELAKDAGLEDLPSHGTGGTTVVARVDAASTAAAGQEIELVLESEEIKLFDPSTGRSLTAA
jgi:multiple sugar transport system ATP-binding protein